MLNNGRTRLLLLLPLMGLFLALSAPVASADVIYTLDFSHVVGASGSGSFGTVTLRDVSADTVEVQITLNGGLRFRNANLPSQNAATIGFNNTSLSNPNVSLVSPPFGWSIDAPGSFGADGFGTFEYSVNCCEKSILIPDGSDITLQLTGAGLSAADFALLSNSVETQAFLAVDVIDTNERKGFVGATHAGQTVPEPGSIITLGFALFGLGVARRKMRA